MVAFFARMHPGFLFLSVLRQIKKLLINHYYIINLWLYNCVRVWQYDLDISFVKIINN